MKSLINFYRRINNFLRQTQVPGLVFTTCKYHPSCSEYAELALEKYGPARGLVKAAGRIVRCNPLSPGGIDYP